MTLGRITRQSRYQLFAIVICLLGARPAQADTAGASDSPAAAIPVPPGLAEVGVEEHLGVLLPLDLAFRDHTGASVRLQQYFDGKRPVLINLMYHRCAMLCSIVLDAVTDGLKGIDWTVGKEFDVLTISIDPHDSPDVADRKRRQILARYGRPEAESGWHFLTGDESEISRVAEALGFHYHWDPEQQQYAHPAAIFVATHHGKIARYLYGVEFAPRDLRFGLLEASEGRSVSTVERILLFCYHYDATGRRYTFLVTRVLRIGGGILLLVVSVVLAMLWRRERRPTTSEIGGD